MLMADILVSSINDILLMDTYTKQKHGGSNTHSWWINYFGKVEHNLIQLLHKRYRRGPSTKGREEGLSSNVSSWIH